MTSAAAPEHDIDMEVTAREDVALGVVRLTLAAVGGGWLPGWEPGAHVDLNLAPELVRQYSLCGDPADRTLYQVAVLREAAGRGGSVFVHDRVTVGTRIRVRGPRNNFALEPAGRYVFLAGGIGITPILPMAAAVQRSGADWSLAYGGRRLVTMAFREELGSRHGDRLSLYPQDEVGLLDLDRLLDEPAKDTLIYCCGPEPLLAAVEQRCASWPAGTLRVERFTPKEIKRSTPDTAFDVRFARSGTMVTVPADTPIVVAAKDAGVMIQTSCREGTCGTCETVVLDGVPDHRDSVLTADQHATSNVMFPCVSRSSGGTLVLDQ